MARLRDMDEPGYEPTEAAQDDKPARSVAALELLIAAMAGVVVVAVWPSWGWSPARAAGSAVLALAALVSAMSVRRLPLPGRDDYFGRHERAGALCALGFALAGVAVVTTGLDRRYPADRDLDALPQVADRVLGHDVAPAAFFAVLAGFVVMAAAALALAGVGQDRASGPGWRRVARPARVALAASLAVTVGVVSAGFVVADRADRRAESGSLVHRVHAEAERMPDETGPTRLPLRQAWRTWSLPYQDRDPSSTDYQRAVVPVPGWNAVLIATQDTTGPMGIVALSKADGNELWRYERANDAGGRSAGAVGVDPESGRILLLSANVAIVLRLADGGEVTTRTLPDGLTCGRRLGIGGSVPLMCEDGDTAAVVLDVASGEMTAGLSADEVADCGSIGIGDPRGRVAVAVAGPGHPDCGRPRLFVHEPERSGFSRSPALEPPEPYDEDEEVTARVDDLTVQDGVFVVQIAWRLPSGEGPEYLPELVAVDTDGTVRWRQRTESLGQVVAYTDEGVLVREREWRLRSLEDGTELAHAPVAEAEWVGLTGYADIVRTIQVDSSTALYTVNAGGDLLVRSLDDLSLRTAERFTHDPDSSIVATDGRLYLVTPDTLTAYTP